jgi:hypothetical protein
LTVAFKTPQEAAKSLGNTISAERLIELAESRPVSDAPESISRLKGLRHIDPARFVRPGVYFLCLGDEVVYVGQSVNVPARVMAHIHESRRPAGKTFDPSRIFYLPVPEGELLRVESEFIGWLKPRYNGGTKRAENRPAEAQVQRRDEACGKDGGPMPGRLFLRGKVWYFRYTAADGRRVMKRLSTDRRVAEQLARKIEVERDLARAGILTAIR